MQSQLDRMLIHCKYLIYIDAYFVCQMHYCTNGSLIRSCCSGIGSQEFQTIALAREDGTGGGRLISEFEHYNIFLSVCVQ